MSSSKRAAMNNAMFSSIPDTFANKLSRTHTCRVTDARKLPNALEKYAVFHFLSWIVGLLINVGTVTPYASVERVDLDLLFGLRTPWLGADVALSIRVNRSSYIWVWGDTLVGNLYADGVGTLAPWSMTHFHL